MRATTCVPGTVAYVEITALDIETDTSPCCYPARECCRARGLDPARSGVIAIALSDRSGDTVLDAATLGGEDVLLRTLESLLATREGTLATWNGAAFDLPYLSDRFATHGIATSLQLTADPSIELKYGPLPGHRTAYRATWGRLCHLDVQFLYRSFAAEHGVSWSLKPVAKALGFIPVEVDRTALHSLTSDEVSAYVASDARLTRMLAVQPPRR